MSFWSSSNLTNLVVWEYFFVEQCIVLEFMYIKQEVPTSLWIEMHRYICCRFQPSRKSTFTTKELSLMLTMGFMTWDSKLMRYSYFFPFDTGALKLYTFLGFDDLDMTQVQLTLLKLSRAQWGGVRVQNMEHFQFLQRHWSFSLETLHTSRVLWPLNMT